MAEPYHGDDMVVCPLDFTDFKRTCAVIVSGDGINACGHALLHVGDAWYSHVAGVYDLPKFMHESGYQRYLKENGKREIRRWIVKLADPVGAHLKLHELMKKPWLWGVLPHNCASFVEEVMKAGGSNAGMYLNCPRAEAFA
ncbi:hypothetical protein [Massilia aerilata]|uniref:DUF4105 domain-containing protein n=1 Tax=Massilia aerilata TaxID=453817 RepID=A0ABW0RYE8_9BURK